MTEGSSGASGGVGGGTGGGGDDNVPLPFQRAVAELTGARPRPEVQLSALPAPKRLAPFAHALEAAVLAPSARPGEDEPEQLADGRFVLLHDPAGHSTWQGTFRLVTLARTELEQEMATDPLLPEVTWSWLTGALEARGLRYGEPGGTVTRSASHFFGGMSDRPDRSELEIRASWTPLAEAATPDAVPDVGAHLVAWGELLCQCAGLPPEPGDGGAVVPLPQRRGPQSM